MLLVGFVAKGSGYVGLAIILAGILLWACGWWSLAVGKGQKRVGGLLILFNLIVTLLVLASLLCLSSAFMEQTLWEWTFLILLVLSLIGLLVILFLPDKNK
jgi:hypothetical protein